jgi:hypothetical protein
LGWLLFVFTHDDETVMDGTSATYRKGSKTPHIITASKACRE